MDNSLMMAWAVIHLINNDSRSALPDAPVVAPRQAGRARRRLARFQRRLASFLHEAAWAIEPEPRTATEP
ncbi:hypothetical protein [Arthrobacter sp. Soil762]|uniref:hypothetical protein n=1 Tax=Arthrobacter sp. Soil762 TaxID=1736401 RepID=UPI0006F2F269|nr:hypothetical protein [Arthrobacter sp. Soil762]KRE80848.1 hypothetical protein ASG77_02590 [Arthrobacter sp. Soil762]